MKHWRRKLASLCFQWVVSRMTNLYFYMMLFCFFFPDEDGWQTLFYCWWRWDFFYVNQYPVLNLGRASSPLGPIAKGACGALPLLSQVAFLLYAFYCLWCITCRSIQSNGVLYKCVFKNKLNCIAVCATKAPVLLLLVILLPLLLIFLLLKKKLLSGSLLESHFFFLNSQVCIPNNPFIELIIIIETYFVLLPALHLNRDWSWWTFISGSFFHFSFQLKLCSA